MTGYDSDGTASETLEVIEYKYTPAQSPEPEVTHPSSSSPETVDSRASKTARVSKASSPRRKKVKRKKNKIDPGQRDVVLFRYFAPNNPEFVKGVSSRTYNLPSSSSESEPEEKQQMDDAVRVPPHASARDNAHRTRVFSGERTDTAMVSPVDNTVVRPLSSGFLKRPLEVTSGPYNMPDGPGTHRRSDPGTAVDMETRRSLFHKPSTLATSQSEPNHSQMRDAAAVDALQRLRATSPHRPSTMQDTIATSPILQPHLISPWRAASGQTLPAITAESPKGIEASIAPKQELILPPVSQLIGETRMASEREHPRTSSYSSASTITGLSPPLGHRILPQLPQPLQSPFQPGPPLSRTPTTSSRDARSPVDIVGDTAVDHSRIIPERRPYHQRRAPPRPADAIPHLISNQGTSSSSKSIASTSGTTSTSANTSTEAFSPDPRPTPTDGYSSEGTPQSFTGTQQPATYLHYPTVPIGGYRCPHEGCDAAPFSTQYLLNSHANVHSQDRPHYCPVEGCARAKSGKGFKRKNEMIRHGLVHQSPGYVCPWCPDREYRYPRPDNLQRHVRMHHEDKDRDDPKLQTVLSKRPIGGNSRGRKRRN